MRKDSREIAEYLWKYEGWDLRAAYKEAEKRIKDSKCTDERRDGTRPFE